jgi:hypothetical protein
MISFYYRRGNIREKPKPPKGLWQSIDYSEGYDLVVFVSLVQPSSRNISFISDVAGPVDREREVCVLSFTHTGSRTVQVILTTAEKLDKFSVGFGVRDGEFAITIGTHVSPIIWFSIIGKEIFA